jgi:gamma-glutamyltranspeptidase/glutathione hydrolase
MSRMNPARWPREEVQKYLQITRTGRDYTTATGEAEHAMVIGSTGQFAQYCGLQALRSGGNALDAAVTTALAQVTLAAGSWVSFAGLAGMVIYDPATRETHSINGPFKSFRNETDPLSIPTTPTPSGRTALVPGFFASLQAAHQRFGKLPWIEVFAPAIWLADNGIPVTDIHRAVLPGRKAFLQRLPESRDVFFPGGTDPWVAGGWFKQPALAHTLRQVGIRGADYIYRGEWARQFVAQVCAEGGRVELADLESYQPLCSRPLVAKAYGHELHTLSAPEVGGLALAQSLRLFEALGIGDPHASGENLYWMIQATLQASSARDVADESCLSDAEIHRVAQAMRARGGAVPPSQLRPGSHTDYVVTADGDGMMVAMCHSINTVMWGSTGINVGGISIPDSACFQQQTLARIKPGDYLSNITNPTLTFKDGKPVLASSSIGSGLPWTTAQCMHAVLALGLDVHQAALRPRWHGPNFRGGDSVASGAESHGEKKAVELTARIVELTRKATEESADRDDIPMRLWSYLPLCIEHGFKQEVIAGARALGVRLDEMDVSDPLISRGFWGALSRDPGTGRLKGARTPGAAGLIVGQ